MGSNEEERKSKLNETEKILKEHGLSRSDVQKLKEKRFDEISEEAKEILESLQIAVEEAEKILIEGTGDTKDVAAKGSKKLEKETKRSKDDEELVEPREENLVREEIEKFLRERSLSQSFISAFLKVGFTEEFHRLLNATGFTPEETEELRRLWDSETKDREEIDSFASLPSSSNEYLSSDGLYLRNELSKPLSEAIREIVAKKPFDPVEYLGHWLLNYKIREEREKKRREFELELAIERERYKPRRDEEEERVSAREDEEEEGEEGFLGDWSFLNDE